MVRQLIWNLVVVSVIPVLPLAGKEPLREPEGDNNARAADGVGASTVDARLAALEMEVEALQSGAASPCQCDCCETCCDPCSCWEAGIGFYYVEPRWQNNQALFTSNRNIDFHVIDFDYDAEFTPLVQLAFHHCSGTGLRARYWSFDDDASVSQVVPTPSPTVNVTIFSAAPLGLFGGANTAGELVTAVSTLNVHVFDLEVTKEFNSPDWQLSLAAGVRYVRLEQGYSYLDRDEALTSAQRFEGLGPTLALDASARMGCSNVWVYGNGRAALAYGRGTQFALRNRGGDLTTVDQRLDDLLPILECETGIHWTRDCAAAQWFATVGVLAQAWCGAGNSSDSSHLESGAARVPETRSNMAFLGLIVEGGVRF